MLDCRSTSPAIDHASGVWFILKFISLAQVIPGQIQPYNSIIKAQKYNSFHFKGSITAPVEQLAANPSHFCIAVLRSRYNNKIHSSGCPFPLLSSLLHSILQIPWSISIPYTGIWITTITERVARFVTKAFLDFQYSDPFFKVIQMGLKIFSSNSITPKNLQQIFCDLTIFEETRTHFQFITTCSVLTSTEIYIYSIGDPFRTAYKHKYCRTTIMSVTIFKNFSYSNVTTVQFSIPQAQYGLHVIERVVS